MPLLCENASIEKMSRQVSNRYVNLFARVKESLRV